MVKNRGLLTNFLLRWLVSALGLWVAAAILGGSRISLGSSWGTVIGAGFFLALVNLALKPILVLFSFPAIILSLGLFMLVINALTILIAAWLYGPFNVYGFWSAVIAGIIVAFVNFSITRVVEDIE